jgi:hypothetical protein
MAGYSGSSAFESAERPVARRIESPISKLLEPLILRHVVALFHLLQNVPRLVHPAVLMQDSRIDDLNRSGRDPGSRP